MVTSGNGSVTKVADAYHGLAAVKLQTLLSGNDTVQGMIVIGTPANQGVSGGVPFSGTPDSITGYAKYEIQPDDTAHFIVAFKKNRAYIAMAMTIFTGTQNTYKRFSIPTYLSSLYPPDSLVAFITSSNMDPPIKVGSTLTIDSISFLNSTQQFPNNDFENWTTWHGPEDPTAWGTYAAQYPNYKLPVLVTKTAEAHSGSYAVKLISETGYIQPPFGSGISGDTIVGTLQLNLINGYMSTKYPFAYKPDSITGYVKGTVSENPDNMNFIWVQLSNNGNVVGQGDYHMQNSQSAYTRFTSPINYSSTLTPDSMTFILFAGNPQKYYPGNVFFVDDLVMVYNGLTGNNALKKPTIDVYPNPVIDKLNIISPEKGTIHIYNTNGMLIKEQNVTQNLSTVSITDFSTGLYLYRITNKTGSTLKWGKLVKK